MRMTMKKLTQGATRLLVLALGLGLVSTGWAVAPTPTVVWRNNLGESYTVGGVAYKFTHDSYNASVGSSVVNGNIVMSDSTLLEGATLDLSGVSNLKKVSVLVKYSGMVTPNRTSGLVSVKNADNVAVGLMAFGENATNIAAFRQTANQVANAYQGNLQDELYQNVNPAIANVLGAGYFLFSYDSDAGASGYIGSSLDTLAGGNYKNDGWNTSNVSKLTLGGSCYYDPFYVWPNLVIEEVYLFIGQCLSNSDVASYDLNTPTATPPTPIAVFNGFSASIETNGNYTLTRNNNTINDDGSISITKGIKLEASAGMSYNSSAGYTIAVKYSNMPASTSGAFVSTDLTALPNNANGIGLWHTSAGKTRGLWQDAEWTGANQTQFDFPNSGVAVYSVGYSDTPYKATAFDKNGNIIYYSGGLCTSTSSTGGKKIYIGSLYNGGNYNTSVLSNMKVEGVAVFNKRLSDSEISAFNSKVFSKIIAANATWSTITSANFNGDGLPTNDAWSDVTINVTESATLTLDSAVTVGKITFNVLPNKTLTLSGAYSITASNGIYVKGGGTLNKGNATLSSAMTISDENTTVISTSMPSANVSIGVGSTYTLKDTKWTGNNNYFSGEGTLYLDTRSGFTSNRITHDVSGATFSGTLKIGVPQANPAYFNSNPENQLTGWPMLRLECGTEASQGQLWVGGSASGKKFQVKNLSGWAKIVPWSNVKGKHYFVTQQEDNTIFSGNFVDWSGSQIGAGEYQTALTVKGGSSVKSLSLTAANETSGPLEVQNNGKVIFSGSGSWNNGTTTVKQGGVIESQRNAQVVGALTFESGAKIAINGSNYFQAGAITVPDNGTVTLDVSDITALPTGTSAATVLKTTTTNLDIDNKFALAGANANYYLAQNTTSGDVTIQMYAAKDNQNNYYKTVSAAFDAIVADHSLTVTILDGTEASHDSELAEKGLIRPNSGALVKFPAAAIKSGETLTPYETVQEAFSALQNMSYPDYRTVNYIAVYESATVQYYSALNAPKVKIEGDEVSLIIDFPDTYGDYWWVPVGEPTDGVATYTYAAKPTIYTWVGSDGDGWSANASWKYDATHNANRELEDIDVAVFISDASVAMGKNASVASITNNANVAFTAASAQTITVGDGGVVMTALGNSITLTNVTLSKVPTTTAATLAVQTTGGGDDPIVYTVVNAVASVDGVGYATMSEASLALKTGSIMTLQQDYDGTVTIYPGKYLVQNGHTVTSVIGAATDDTTDDGIVVTRSGNSVANYYWSCVDQRTATWSGAGSAYWTVMGNWVEQFTPTTYTAVTIPATEGHATAITLSGDVSIKSLTLCAGETLTLSRSGDADRTFTTSQAIVLTSGQSIVTGAGVSISPAIITEDANSYVKFVTLDGATTYTVADHKATVYDSEDAEVKKYDTVADAVSAATDGQKVTLFADSGEAITLNDKSVTFNEGSSTFTGSFAGNGTLVLPALWKSGATERIASGWTGTVVLPQVNGTPDGFRFDHYGRTGSTIKIENGFNGWLNAAVVDARQVKANLIVNSAFTINGTNSGTWYNLAKMSGTGNFSLIQSNAPSGFHILVLEDYSGTLSNTIGSGTPTALTVSRLNLAEAPVAGQKLINTTTPNAVNLESVYVGDAQQSVSLVKGSDGIYVALVSVTKGDNPTTYYATVSDAMTAAGSDAATITLLGNTDSNVSLAVGQSLVTGGFSVGTVSTSAEHYHVVNNAGVYTVAIDQFAVTIPSVANTTVSVSYTSGAVAQVATAAGDIMADYGTDVTATWTAASGYRITSGASQTLNAVTSAQTLASPTVEAMGATVSDVSVSYGADYASARVTATISDTTLDYYISWSSGEPVKGSVSGSQVTFDVSGINHTTEYQSAAYSITAKDGEAAVTTTGGSGTSVAADTTAWFSQSSANSGAPVGGSWATAVNLSTPTNVTDNTFEATAPSTSSRVVLEFEVCFSSTSEEDVSGEAQAAIKLGVVNSVTTFMVLTNGNNWAAVSAAGFVPEATETYKVVLTIDYVSNTYRVDVEGHSMTNVAGAADFSLATIKSSVQTIDFAGSGTLTSMKGDQVEGYMVVDKNGTRYPSIAAAISAYTQNPSIGPLRVLHSGTAPSGWRIDGDTLIKVAKGLFFMAF